MTRNFIQRTIIALSATFAVSTAADAASVGQPKVYDIDVAVNETEQTVEIDLQFNLADYRLGRNQEIVLQPLIIDDQSTDSVMLDPIVIAGRNRWYWHVRQGETDGRDARRIYRAGQDETVTITDRIPFRPWMGQSTVELRQLAATCCNTPDLVPGTSPHLYTEVARIDTRRPPLGDRYVFAPPVDDAPVEKNIEGKAFVSFVVNRTELKPDYMVNRREIAKIINSIDFVRNDTDAVITGIHIKGFASPEGPYSNNVRLAQGRTRTLSNYVRDLYAFPDSIVSHSFNPEDWPGLRTYITDSLDYNIAHRREILELIDSDLEPDYKDRMLKQQFPEDYAVILKEIYPWLRHSDYTVKYRIKVYTDLAELNRLYAADPSKLRPVDFYTIAAQYPEGSQKYLDVMQTAVEVYPDDPMLNLNAANINLMAERYDEAQAHLAKAGRSPQADFARGVLAARRKQYAEAERYLCAAEAAGITQATAYLDEVTRIRDYHPVTITVTPTKK